MFKWFRERAEAMSESAEQKIVCDFMDLHGLDYFHVPNGAHFAGAKGQRVAQSRKLKALGMRKGVPDLIIITPAKFHGMPVRGVAIEMKAPNGRGPTEDQDAWLKKLVKAGWVCAVSYGADDAIDFIKEFEWKIRVVDDEVMDTYEPDTSAPKELRVAWEIDRTGSPVPDNICINGAWYYRGIPLSGSPED